MAESKNALAYRINRLWGDFGLLYRVELGSDDGAVFDGDGVQYCISGQLVLCYGQKRVHFVESPIGLHFMKGADCWSGELIEFVVNYNVLPPETHVMFMVFVLKPWDGPECVGFGVFPVFAWSQNDPRLLPVFNFGVFHVRLFRAMWLSKVCLGPKYPEELDARRCLNVKGVNNWAFTTYSLESLGRDLLDHFLECEYGDGGCHSRERREGMDEAWLEIEALEIGGRLLARAECISSDVLELNAQEIDEQNRHRMRLLENLPPTDVLSSEDKRLWLRYYMVSCKNANLARFTTCVDWTDSRAIEEYLPRIEMWDLGNQSKSARYAYMSNALFSLKYFSHLLKTQGFQRRDFDVVVRVYVKKFLKSLSLEELELMVLQIVQCCHFDESMVLFNFVVTKCLVDWNFANGVYWKLKVLGNEQLLKGYVESLEGDVEAGRVFMRRIRDQESLTFKLNEMAMRVQEATNKNKDEILREHLGRMRVFPRPMTLPIFPDVELREMDGWAKCFPSANMPILIKFLRSGGDEGKSGSLEDDSLRVIYKRGDDLRQDALCLQLLRILDELMVEAGFQNVLKLYRIFPLSLSDGFIEFIPDSLDLAEIFNLSGISEYLREKNPDSNNFKEALYNYYRSCACYCVANYVFGITDRHNNNIMINRQGYLFHIDFGFMFGYSPNRLLPPEAPVKLSDRMLSPINQYGLYEMFIAYCREVYLLMRHNANIFITLIMLMGNTNLSNWSDDYKAKFIEGRLGLNPRVQDDEQAWNVFRNYLEKAQLHIGSRVKDAVHDFQTYWVKTSQKSEF